MLRRMTQPRLMQCRWKKVPAPGGFKLILQQWEMVGQGPMAEPIYEWIDVPIHVSSDQVTTQAISRSGQSGPQEAVTGKTVSALEPIEAAEDPEGIEVRIERMMQMVVHLMKARSEMSSFPPYDGTLVLVHGTGKQRMFVNGFERTMPIKCLLVTRDEDIHLFQSHTDPISPNLNPKKPS